jgi:hypothetical protein
VWTFVHAEGLSFKKTLLPAEQDRPTRARWKVHQGRIDASRLVFDETWIKTNMAPLPGWGPSGQRWQDAARGSISVDASFRT